MQNKTIRIKVNHSKETSCNLESVQKKGGKSKINMYTFEQIVLLHTEQDYIYIICKEKHTEQPIEEREKRVEQTLV